MLTSLHIIVTHRQLKKICLITYLTHCVSAKILHCDPSIKETGV